MPIITSLPAIPQDLIIVTQVALPSRCWGPLLLVCKRINSVKRIKQKLRSKAVDMLAKPYGFSAAGWNGRPKPGSSPVGLLLDFKEGS